MIIRVAKKLLLENGPLDFSLRAVALSAGISVSNLQYYFPTRPDVLRAIMTPLIEAYIDELKQASVSDASPEQIYEETIEHALRDARDSKNVALWWHFCSFAAVDPECAQLRDDWYDAVTTELASLIRVINPARGVAESTHIAMLLTSMADGLILHLGTPRSKRPYMRGIDEAFREAADAIVWGEARRPRK